MEILKIRIARFQTRCDCCGKDNDNKDYMMRIRMSLLDIKVKSVIDLCLNCADKSRVGMIRNNLWKHRRSQNE